MGKKIAVAVLAVGLCIGAVWVFLSCGSSGSDAGSSYSVTATVAIPTTANLSTGKSAGLGKAIVEEPAVGVEVQPQDIAGNAIGTPCTTGADGTCAVSLTSDQLQAGVVFVAQNMHSFQEFDSVDIAAADAGTALTAPINTEEDVVYGLVVHNCGGALSACPPTIDTDCLHDAVAVLPGDDEPGTDTVDGYMEGLIAAHARARVNDPAGANGGLVAALGGDPTRYAAAVGAPTVSGVPLEDAIVNSQVGAGTVNSAYCTRASAGAESPWETARAAAATTDTPTFSRAMAGMFEYFPPSELRDGLYPPAQFQAFMTAGPQLDGFYGTVGGADNELARNAFVQGFKNGMFADPANAHVAIGFIGATFPAPVNGVIPWTDNAYDPQTAVMAGRNAFVEMTNAGSFNPAQFTPNGIYAAFQPAMGDPTRRQTFANGGCSDYVGAFMGNPTGFVPMDNFGQIKSPPGGSCTTSADCMPCDSCASSVCVAGSSKMGSSCSTDSDCDQITLCVGPPNTAYSTVAMKNCMCASAVPTGMGVFTGAGTGPQQYGMTGGYAPPTNGAQGAPCGPGQPPCAPGLSCTGSQYGGVCVPGDFKFGPGAPCTGNSQCMSDTCTGGFCSGGGAGGACGTKANGTTCMAPMECLSCMCNAGICAATGGGGTRLPDGSACTNNDGCYSNFCDGGTCRQPGGGAPAGSPCNNNEMCLSRHCNFGMSPSQCGT